MSNDAIVTDNMKLRMHGCVALGTSGNWQGLTIYFDLDTGKVVTRRIVKELPYTDRVIKRVNEWGKTPRGENIQTVLNFVIVKDSRSTGKMKM